MDENGSTVLSAPRCDRRTFLMATAAGVLSIRLAAKAKGLAQTAWAAPEPIGLPPLPYADDALEPVISKATVGFHFGKHHKGYVDNLNKLIAGTDYASMPLERIIAETSGRPEKAGIFNNAAQVWNHTFYWSSMKPHGGGEPPAGLRERLKASFGSVEACKKELHAAGMAVFGSGWVWLVYEAGRLKVATTPNAEVPFLKGAKPLLTIDVWEHAYYLDYQNRRGDYLRAVLDSRIDWGYASKNLEG